MKPGWGQTAEKLKNVADHISDAAKWMKENGKTVGVPLLTLVAMGAGPVVNVASAKEEAIEDLVDHYARCLKLCQNGNHVSAEGVLVIQEMSVKFDKVAQLCSLPDEWRGLATYYFTALSYQNKNQSK